MLPSSAAGGDDDLPSEDGREEMDDDMRLPTTCEMVAIVPMGAAVRRDTLVSLTSQASEAVMVDIDRISQ